MTDIPMGIEVNCETGVVTERPLTATEIAQMETDRAEDAARKADQETAKAAKDALKASAKAKLIAGQPLTEEEAETLII